MKIARTSQHSHHHYSENRSKLKEQVCSHAPEHEHRHSVGSGPLPYIRESYVELPHAALETFVGHEASTLGGAAHGAIGALAAVRGVQNLRAGGLIHNIEGAGNLALAAASGLTAYEMFTEIAVHSEHAVEEHGHGLGAVTALEVAHGLAEIAVGGIELKKGTKRPGVSLLRIAKGSAVLAAQLIPAVAPVATALHLGAVLATTAADPNH